MINGPTGLKPQAVYLGHLVGVAAFVPAASTWPVRNWRLSAGQFGRTPTSHNRSAGVFGVRRCPPLVVAIRTEQWQGGQMGALFVLCGILVGLAIYRSGEARSRWQQLRSTRTTRRNQRNTAWRQTGSAALYVLGAILLIVIVLKLLK
jgi:hypothetical protein